MANQTGLSVIPGTDAMSATAHVVADVNVQRTLSVWLEAEKIETRTYLHLGAFLEFLIEERSGHVPCCLVIDAQPTAICGLEAQAILLPLSIRFPIVIVEKPMCEQRIVAAILAAVDAARRQQVAQSRLASICERYATLTPREQQVMSLVVSGLMNKQVGSDLGVSEITVKAHRGAAVRKMGARSFAELVRMADALADFGNEGSNASRSARSSPTRSVAAADLRMG